MVFSVATLVQRQREIEKGLKHVKMPATQNYARLVLLKNAPLPYCDFSVLWTANVASQRNLAEKDPLPEISQGQNSSILSALNWSSVPGHMGLLGLSLSVVQFHLRQLQKSGLITSLRKKRYKPLFAAGNSLKGELEIIAALRVSTFKDILVALLEGRHILHHEIATQLSILSQGLTWQIRRFRYTGSIQETKHSSNVNH